MSHGKPFGIIFLRGVTNIICSISCVTIPNLYRNSILLQNLMARLSAMWSALNHLSWQMTVTNISVLPEYQQKGIGGKMIALTKERAFDMGFRAILLCGDPDYYLRQRFIPAETLGIRTEDNMYATALHVYELYDNALANAKGRYIEDEIYQVDKSAANEFDKRFPPKEIIVGTPSQKRFDQIVVMRRKAI